MCNFAVVAKVLIRVSIINLLAKVFVPMTKGKALGLEEQFRCEGFSLHQNDPASAVRFWAARGKHVVPQ